jgi:Ca2+-binding EF-hand superfamily protein
MDTNDDGRVTEDEFLAPLREAFQRMDEDRDGALDDGERPRRDR